MRILTSMEAPFQKLRRSFRIGSLPAVAIIGTLILAGCLKTPTPEEKTKEDFGPEIAFADLKAHYQTMPSPNVFGIQQGDHAMIEHKQIIDNQRPLTVDTSATTVVNRIETDTAITFTWETQLQEYFNGMPKPGDPTRKQFTESLQKSSSALFKWIESLISPLKISVNLMTESKAETGHLRFLHRPELVEGSESLPGVLVPGMLVYGAGALIADGQGRLLSTAQSGHTPNSEANRQESSKISSNKVGAAISVYPASSSTATATYHNFSKKSVQLGIPEFARTRPNCGGSTPDFCTRGLRAEQFSYDTVIWEEGKAPRKITNLLITSADIPFFIHEYPSGPDLVSFVLTCSEGLVELPGQKVRLIDCLELKDMRIGNP